MVSDPACVCTDQCSCCSEAAGGAEKPVSGSPRSEVEDIERANVWHPERELCAASLCKARAPLSLFARKRSLDDGPVFQLELSVRTSGFRSQKQFVSV